MLYKRDFEEILTDVQFGSWTVLVKYDSVGMEKADYPTTRCYLQISGVSDNAVTRGRYAWRGRKWFLSPHMVRSEVVQTAFMAILAAVEHETREMFQYKGAAIYGPHFDVDKLAELVGTEGALDVRIETGGESHG